MTPKKAKFWTPAMIMMMVTEGSIVYHMDFYSSAIPAWFTRMGFVDTKIGTFSVIGLTSSLAMGFMWLGGIVAAPLLRHSPTRQVQFFSLTIMLLSAWWHDKIDGWGEMMFFQSIRDFCAVGIIACGMRARKMLHKIKNLNSQVWRNLMWSVVD